MKKLIIAAAIMVPVMAGCTRTEDRPDVEIDASMEERDVTVPTFEGEDTIRVKVPDVDVRQND